MVDTIAGLIQCQPVFDTEAKLPAPIPLNYVSDVTRIREELGWSPQMNIERGLRSLV
jgi:nucleoside-diphosphate-sugar epimerase